MNADIRYSHHGLVIFPFCNGLRSYSLGMVTATLVPLATVLSILIFPS